MSRPVESLLEEASAEKAKAGDTFRNLCRVLARQIPYLRPVSGKLLLVFLFSSICMALLVVIPALLQGRAVDQALMRKDLRELVVCLAGIVAVYLIMLSVQAFRFTMQSTITVRTGIRLYQAVYEHFLRHSIRFHSERPIGELMYRGSIDVRDTTTLLFTLIPEVIVSFFSIVFAFLLASAMSSRVTIAVVCFLLGYFLSAHGLMSMVRGFDRTRRARQQQMRAVLQESLSAWLVTLANSREAFQRRRYAEAIHRMVHVEFRFMAIGLIYTTLAGGALYSAFEPVLRVIAGAEYMAGSLTLGQWTIAIALAWQVVDPCQKLVQSFQMIRLTLVPGERLMETLSTDVEIVDAPNAVDLPRIEGKIEFENVTFGYSEKPVLENISFKVEPGHKVALVGPSGAGKTSLTDLLLRFYDPQKGSIRIDGRDIREVTQKSLRKQTAIVLQGDGALFAGTIRENVHFAKPEATDEELRRAAEEANAWEFIESLPGQFDTRIAESGSLSLGQRQRVGLTRALVRDPRILILDEATSAVDPMNEAAVVGSLNRSRCKRTTVVIAHNLMQVRDADLILVLNHGRIVQRGRHDELLREPGFYREMWRTEQTAQALTERETA